MLEWSRSVCAAQGNRMLIGSGHHVAMYNYSFLDAYLVTSQPGVPPWGVVRREGHVWKIMLFGVDKQPAEVFATRGTATNRLMELAHQKS